MTRDGFAAPWLDPLRAYARLLPAAAACCCLLALDMRQPAGILFSPLYVIPIILTTLSGSPRATYLTFVACSVLTVAVAAFGPAPTDASAAFYSRTLALVAQVLATALVIRQLSLQEAQDTDVGRKDQQLVQARYAMLKVQEQLIAVQTAERERTEFISMVTHELRMPVTTARGYAQMARARAAKAGSAEIDAPLVKAIEQVDRLNRMVSELLDVTRIHADHLQLHCLPLNLAVLVAEIAEQQRAANPDRAIDLHADQPAPILGDAQRLGQVFSNLLDNGLKYSPAGGPVVIRLERQGDDVQVTVQDQGIGIPESEQERLFERYYRGPSGAPRFQGLGVGLYISHQIVVRHGGRMWVRGAEGVGSTFGVVLPLEAEPALS
jgi:signal transduction histidine kinase